MASYIICHHKYEYVCKNYLNKYLIKCSRYFLNLRSFLLNWTSPGGSYTLDDVIWTCRMSSCQKCPTKFQLTSANPPPPQALQPIQSHLSLAIYESWRNNQPAFFRCAFSIYHCTPYCIYPERHNYICSYLILCDTVNVAWMILNMYDLHLHFQCHICTQLVSAICRVNNRVQMLLFRKS